MDLVRRRTLTLLIALLAVATTARAAEPGLPCVGVAGALRAGLDADRFPAMQDASAGIGAPTVPGLHVIVAEAGAPTTTLHFDVPHDTEISLRVYDLRGRVLDRLVEGRLGAGRHTRVWTPDETVPSGVVLVRLDADRHVLVRKATLVR